MRVSFVINRVRRLHPFNLDLEMPAHTFYHKCFLKRLRLIQLEPPVTQRSPGRVTVIKAIFDDTAPLLQQIDVDPVPHFTDETGQPLTVGGELDKLASNVALGRNFGGVHFRSDGEHGILLGEEVAIRFLQDHLRTYRENFHGDSGQQTAEPHSDMNVYLKIMKVA